MGSYRKKLEIFRPHLTALRTARDTGGKWHQWGGDAERERWERLEIGEPSTVDKEELQEMKHWIQENFRERMQLRRSLIELEDQLVQNSIEIGSAR